jgi:hypothetical protein
VLASAQMLRLCRKGGDLGIRQPADEVDVVGGEILDDAHVLDAGREGAAANRGNGEQPSDLALEQAPAHFLKRRVEALDMPDRREDARVVTDLNDLMGRVGGRGQWLLDQHRDTRGRELLRHRQVQFGGDGDDGELQGTEAEQRGDRVEHELGTVHGPEAVPAGIDGAGELHSVGILQEPRVMAADHPQPDHRPARQGPGLLVSHGG